MNPTTPKTPAEAADEAHKCGETREVIAKATIEAHLATVAEGLPTLEDAQGCMIQRRLMLHENEAISELFATRFAKLQAELEREKNLSRAFAIDGDGLRKKLYEVTADHERLKANYIADWIACEKVLTSAGINMEPTEYGGKTVEAGIEELKAERDELKSMNQKASEAFTQANLTERSLRAQLANERASLSGTLMRVDCLEREVDERRETISAMNERLIERTEGFMKRLEEKTKRERYVPLEDHEEMKRVAVEALEGAATWLDRVEGYYHGPEHTAACQEVTEALTKLKGTEQ